MFVRASLYKRREENQLVATECFIVLIICSTCFGHLYAHHQELETILVLLPHIVCNALVAGGRLLGTEQQAMRPGTGRITCCSAPKGRHYTPYAACGARSTQYGEHSICVNYVCSCTVIKPLELGM